MEQAQYEHKYQKHSEKQFMLILSVAEKLFVENGIDNVNLSDITNECGIMRATFYRYFKNKDEVLWHVMRLHATRFSDKLFERFQETGGKTYEKVKTFLDILYEDFVDDPSIFLFIDLFNNTYQSMTSQNNDLIYDSIYGKDDFRSGDTVRFLTENFHDGSVKPGLDPKTTAVSITYSAMSVVAVMAKQIKTLHLKYEVSPNDVVRFSFDALLDSIRA